MAIFITRTNKGCSNGSVDEVTGEVHIKKFEGVGRGVFYDNI